MKHGAIRNIAQRNICQHIFCTKLARQAKGVKAIQLSDAIGLSQPALSKIENGGQNITHETLVAIQKILGVNINWLLTGEGEMFLTLASGEVAHVPVVVESRPQTGEKGVCGACGQPYGVKGLLESREREIEGLKREIGGKDAQIALQNRLLQKAEEQVEEKKTEIERLKNGLSLDLPITAMISDKKS